MNILTAWKERILVPIDGLLWKQGISHGVIRPLLRNQILAAGAMIVLGGLCWIVWPWLFWAACGFVFMSLIFISWTRFFLFSGSRGVMEAIARLLGRLMIFAALLFVCVRYLGASAIAIAAGLTAATITGFLNFAYYSRKAG